MWDLRVANPFGRLSIRNILAFAATTLAAIFAFIVISAPNALAADIIWNGANLTYQGNTYSPATLPEGNGTSIPKDAKVYSWAESNVGGDTAQQKIHFIYFEPGTDASKATNAKYVEYLFTPPDKYENPSGQKDITIDPATYGNNKSECAVTGGMGWLICGISNVLANSMDAVFNILRTFIEVKPLSFTQDSGLYSIWNIMRSFANVMFIIGFLIIIYSQVTTFGISNYGIKKALPRLIIAAILVNISYIICAIAIDLSNIIGLSLQDLLMNIREQVFKMDEASADGYSLTWENITAYILTGGAAAVALPSLLGATGGAVMSAVYALIPILLGLFLILLVVLVILAARQAIIILLVVIAPLAFVAYLLPGTEKWFKKWQDVFVTMLVFFPAFSLIFGGAQLAGSLIIQNAQTIIMVVFGMAVQIAPLAIVPLILKLSGSLLGKIAGMVNDPKRGLLDRTKNWAGERQEFHKQRGIGGNLKKRNVARRWARRLERNRHQLKQNTERYKQGFEGHVAEHAATSRKGQKVEVELRLAKLNTERWQNELNQAFAEMKAGDGKRLRELRAEAPSPSKLSQFGSRVSDRLTGNNYENFATDAIKRAQEASKEARLISQATHTAEHMEQQEYAKAILASDTLQARAGGIGGQHGADSALASAVNAQREAYGKHVAEAHQVIKHFNLSSEKRQDLALGKDVLAKDSNGVERLFKASDIYAREAVIEKQVSTGTVEQVEQIVELSGSKLADFRTTISDEVAKAGLGAKTIYLGGATINEIAKGEIKSRDHLVGIIQDNITKGKISADKLVSIDKDAVKSILNAVKEAQSGNTSFMHEDLTKLPGALADLKQAAYDSLTDKRLSARVAGNVKPMLEDLRDLNL